MDERYKLSQRKLMGLIVLVLLVGVVVGEGTQPFSYLNVVIKEKWKSTVNPSTTQTTIIFEINYHFNDSAYQIVGNVKMDNDTFHLVFPERNPSGWSPAGNGGHFTWNVTVPRQTQSFSYYFQVTFIKGYILNPCPFDRTSETDNATTPNPSLTITLALLLHD